MFFVAGKRAPDLLIFLGEGRVRVLSVFFVNCELERCEVGVKSERKGAEKREAAAPLCFSLVQLPVPHAALPSHGRSQRRCYICI